MKLGEKVPEEIRDRIRKAMLKGVSLSRDTPKVFRGREAERLVCGELRDYGIGCEKAEEPADRQVFVLFKKDAKRVPIQVKSISLAKHGWAIHCDDTPLELFEGWYIILIEHDPRDHLLFVHSDKMKERFEKDGYRAKSPGNVRPHIKRKFLDIPKNLSDGWSDYLDPSEFFKDVGIT